MINMFSNNEQFRDLGMIYNITDPNLEHSFFEAGMKFGMNESNRLVIAHPSFTIEFLGDGVIKFDVSDHSSLVAFMSGNTRYTYDMHSNQTFGDFIRRIFGNDFAKKYNYYLTERHQCTLS